MSTVGAATRWFERAIDFANAILVKETRQALKSRQFVVVFMLLLTASWAASMFGLVMKGDAIEYGSAGREFFLVFFMVLSAAVLLIVPFGAYRSLLAERDQNTFELLSITTLTPRQIVWGKLLSALVQTFIFYSAITPFIAFASLLQGFDVATAAYWLIAAMLVSLFFSTAALMLWSFARQRASQAATSIVVLGSLGIGFAGFIQFPLSMPILFDAPEFWWGNVFIVLAGLSYIVLFQQIAIAQLTFESDNRSTRIRMTCAAQFWLLWLVYMGFHRYYKTPWQVQEIQFLTNVSVIHWSLVGLLAATEGDHLSRRVRRQLPRNPLARLLVAPLMPGGARGYLFLLLHLAALWLLSAGLMLDAVRAAGGPTAGRPMTELFGNLGTFTSTSWLPELRIATACCCYVLFYVGIGAMVGRWLRSVTPEIKPGHIRVLSIFIFGAGLIGPLIPRMIEPRAWRGYSLIQITNPFETFDAIYRGGFDFQRVMPLLLGGALLVVLMNLRAMFHGVREILQGASQATALHHPESAAGLTTSTK